MKTISKAVIGLLAALALSWASAAYAADNGTEFGIEDDLSVLGTTGTWADPDMEIKGFSIFGPLTGPQRINGAPGNVVITGNLQADATSYFGSSVTIAGQAVIGSSLNVAGYGVFQSTVMIPAGNLKYGNGGAGLVMKSGGDGFVYWGTDQQGTGITGSNHWVPIYDDVEGMKESRLVQNVGDNNITLMASSMTIQGTGVDGLGVTGAVKIDGALSVLNANTFSVGTGLASLGGGLTVVGASTMTGILSVNNAAYFGAAATKSTFTTTGALFMSSGTSITLIGNAAKITLPNLPAVGTDAANKNYVDSQIGAGGPWTRDNALNVVKLSTITDRVGIGIAAPAAELHVSSANAASGDMLLIVSSGTLTSQQVLTVKASGDTMAKGSAQLGDDPASDIHGVNMAPAANVALSVAGNTNSGNYVTKFYSGAAMAAWIKKK